MIEQFTHDLVQWIRVLPPFGIYLIFFMIAYFENVVPPIPGDVLVAFAGYLAAESVIDLAPVYILVTAASVIGFMTMYWLGSHWGGQLEERRGDFWLVRFIPLTYMTKVREWMKRWGQGVILANRFLAGTRSVISIAAGISHIRVSSTVISSTISSLLWNAILLGFGWIVHKNWEIIGNYLAIYSRIILGGIGILILAKFSIYYYNKKRGAQNKTLSS